MGRLSIVAFADYHWGKTLSFGTRLRARNALFIVVGSRGLGAITGAVIGSVSSAVLHRADRPVMVVPVQD